MMQKSFAVLLSLCLATSAMALDWPEGHTRTLILDNRCNDTMRVVVTYSPYKGVWEKAGWYKLEPGARIYPRHTGERLQHRDNASLYLYMRSADDRFEVKGSHGTNFGGEHLKSYETARFLRGDYVEVRMNCD